MCATRCWEWGPPRDRVAEGKLKEVRWLLCTDGSVSMYLCIYVSMHAPLQVKEIKQQLKVLAGRGSE
jgi:hypothetical protein